VVSCKFTKYENGVIWVMPAVGKFDAIMDNPYFTDTETKFLGSKIERNVNYISSNGIKIIGATQSNEFIHFDLSSASSKTKVGCSY
jgi:hypothetical protein